MPVSGSKKALFILLLIAGLLYADILSAPFYFDDGVNILQNETIRMEGLHWPQVERILRENFVSRRQIAFISFGLNYALGGYNPFGYHVFNIVLHLLNLGLVWLFAFKTLSLLKLERRHALPAAFLAALLWGIHPIQTNVAAYVVQRMVSLATLFSLLAFLAYIEGRLCMGWSGTRAWFFLAALLYLLSLLCKEITLFLPFLILVYDCAFFPAGRHPRRFLVGLSFSIFLILAVIGHFGGMGMVARTLHNFSYRDFTLRERLLTETRVVFHYLSLLFFPAPDRFTLYHDDYPVSTGFFSPMTTAVSCLGLILAVLSVVFFILTGRWVYAFGILWYFVNLAVESTFLALEPVFEHRAYLPSIGVFLMVSYWVTRLHLRFPGRRPFILCLVCLFILFEIFGTVLRNQHWANKPVFYQHALEKAPDSARVLSTLSIVYFHRGDIKMARHYVEKALEKKPDDIYLLVGHFFILKDMGREEQAGGELSKINALLEDDRYGVKDTLGLQNLAEMFYHKKKDYRAAVRYWEYIIRKNDQIPIVFLKLGQGYLHLHEPGKALKALKKLMKMRPDTAENNFFTGLAYKMAGRDREAIAFVQRALRLSPRPRLLREMGEIMKGWAWHWRRLRNDD